MHCSAVDQANHTNHLKITVQTVYISNESATLVDVYFDDIKVTYTPGRVIQANEYYPFGLQTATSWTRENNLGNNFLYNGGTELNKTTQVYDLYYRNYDPVLGRFGQVDPMAGKYGPVSPYHFAGNNPVVFNDPMGDEYDAFSVMDGSYVASGRGESVYRDMDPWGRYTTARIIAQSMEAIRIMRDAQDSEITVADGAHTFIFNSNGTVNYSYTSDAEFLSLLGRGYDHKDLRAMYSGAPIVSNYQGGPRLWQGLDGGFAVLKNGIAYIPGTDRRYAGVLQFQGKERDNAHEGILTRIWNSDLFRLMVPDVYTLDISIGCAVGYGRGETYTINLVTRGADAGLHRTSVLPAVYGAEIGYGVNFGYLNFHGPASSLSRNTLTGPSVSVSGGLGAGMNLNFGYPSWDTSKLSPSLSGMSVGIGDTVGLSATIGDTVPGWWPFWR